MDYSITYEHVNGARERINIINRVRRLFEDKAYNLNTIYNEFGGKAIIHPKKNVSTLYRGFP